MSIQPTLQDMIYNDVESKQSDELFEELCDLLGSTSYRDITHAEAIAHELQYRMEQLQRKQVVRANQN
jgi:hypothetical protein